MLFFFGLSFFPCNTQLLLSIIFLQGMARNTGHLRSCTYQSSLRKNTAKKTYEPSDKQQLTELTGEFSLEKSIMNPHNPYKILLKSSN